MDKVDRSSADYFQRRPKTKYLANSRKKKRTEIFKKELKDCKRKTINYIKTTEWMSQMKSDLDVKNYLPCYL